MNPLISCLNTTTLFSRAFFFLTYTWKAFPGHGFSHYLRQFYQLLRRGLFLSSCVCMACTNKVDHSLKNQIIVADKGPEPGNLYISCFQTGFWRNWCLVTPVAAWHVTAQGHYWRGTVLVPLPLSQYLLSCIRCPFTPRTCEWVSTQVRSGPCLSA